MSFLRSSCMTIRYSPDSIFDKYIQQYPDIILRARLIGKFIVICYAYIFWGKKSNLIIYSMKKSYNPKGTPHLMAFHLNDCFICFWLGSYVTPHVVPSKFITFIFFFITIILLSRCILSEISILHVVCNESRKVEAAT